MAVLHFPGFQHFWSLLKALLDLKAPLESPELTGDPTAPTQEPHDNSTKVATTEYVDNAVAELVNSSPAALDTLKELSDAIGGDANFSTTMTNALALKAPLASPALTGSPTAPTQNAGDNSTKIATTAYADRNDAACVHLAGAETVSGAKTFTAYPVLHGTGPVFGLSASEYVKGTNPATQRWGGVHFIDKTKDTATTKRAGCLEFTVATNGQTEAWLRAYNWVSGSSARGDLGIIYPKDGTPYTQAPTPAAGDNSTKIATTAFVTTAVANEDATCVHTTGNETIAGTKTFSSAITGSVSGNAGTATKIQTAPSGTSWVNGVKAGGALVSSTSTSYGAVFNAPTKNYRVSLGTYPSSDDLVYLLSITNANVTAGTNTTNKTLTWNAANGTLAATSFSGPLVGNVTGNCSGSSGSCTGNAKTATTLATARDINISDADGTNTGTKISFNGSANGTIKLPATIKASITGNCSGSSGSCTGNAATATKTTATIAVDKTGELVHATMGSNDLFRIAVGGGSNAGWAEIATGDDYSEPIYVRQYQGAFTTLKRTATLLDGSGNTSFPGTVTANAFSGPLTGNVTGNCSGSSGSCTGNAANVTGTVAIEHGGTGATTRLAALKALTNENVGTSAQHFLVITDSWGKGGYCGVASAKTVLGLKSAAYTESSAYIAKTTNVSEMGRYIDIHYDNATQKYDYDVRICANSQGDAAGRGLCDIYANELRIHASSSNQLRLVQGNYGVLLRNDGSNFYFLKTASGSADAGSWDSTRPLTINLSTGVCNINGNAATATTLATTRKINGVSFNGSADITVADSTKLPLAGGTMTGQIKITRGNADAGGGIRFEGKGQNYAISIMDTNVTKATDPGSSHYMGIDFYGKTNSSYKNRIGLLQCTYAKGNVSEVGIYAYNCTSAENTGTCAITCKVDGSGNSITYAPTPANNDRSTKIATTAYIGNCVVPKDTRMLFQQSAAPTGWTKETGSGYNNTALRFVTGDVANKTNGKAFTTCMAAARESTSTTQVGTISDTTAGGTVGDKALSVAMLAKHKHNHATTIGTSTASGDNKALSYVSRRDTKVVSGGIHETGSGSNHNHSFTGSSHKHTFTGSGHTHKLDLDINYIDCIIAKKA